MIGALLKIFSFEFVFWRAQLLKGPHLILYPPILDEQDEHL